MNKGLALAKGTYVIWINSGDEFISTAWAVLSEKLLCSGASVLAGSIEVIRHEKECVTTSTRVLRNEQGRMPFQPLHHQAVVFRRTKAIQYRGYPLDYNIVSDRALCLSMYLANEAFDFTDDIVARFESGGVSCNALLREQENYRLDLEYGLIGMPRYLVGRARSVVYHRLTIPLWSQLKQLGAVVGLSSLPRPSFLVRLFREPSRS
jgi:hypothetical protein